MHYRLTTEKHGLELLSLVKEVGVEVRRMVFFVSATFSETEKD
jgi:hypothetical protein